jgi:hypothetical protein
VLGPAPQSHDDDDDGTTKHDLYRVANEACLERGSSVCRCTTTRQWMASCAVVILYCLTGKR